MGISKEKLNSLRHPSESSRFNIMMIVIVPVVILFALLLMFSFGLLLLYIAFVYLIVWMVIRVTMANFLNNTVRVTENSFPEIADAIMEAKDLFGYEGDVQAFIFEDGTYNAAIMPMLRSKVILVNSEMLIDQPNNDEIRFIVGRFVGALASRHYRLLWLQVVLDTIEKAQIFNLLLYPYERAVQYSGDQLGLFFLDGNLEAATRTLLKTVVGRSIANRVSMQDFLIQGIESRGKFFVWLARAFSRFPHSTHRLENLYRFGNAEFPVLSHTHIARQSESTQAIIEKCI